MAAATARSVHEQLCCYDAGPALRYALLVILAGLVRMFVVWQVALAVVAQRAARRLDGCAARVPQSAPAHRYRGDYLKGAAR